MRLFLYLFLIPSVVFGQQNQTEQVERSPKVDDKSIPDVVQYVNPFIGTGGHGHTFPGATVPYGMVQLSPDTRIDGSWDGCSGYHYSDSFIYGFSHTHLSGTGVSDYGDILFLPSSNPIPWGPEEYKTPFRHGDEQAAANSYSVRLRQNEVMCWLTTTQRTGLHEYLFKKDEAYLLIDLQHRDELLDHQLKKSGRKSVAGFRISKAWAQEQHVYFYAEFSESISEIIYNSDSSKAVLHFKNMSSRTLRSEVGLSFTSVDGAKKNLNSQEKESDWAERVNNALIIGQKAWNDELSKIEVFTKDEDKKHIFYTALYHCMMHPNIAEDADGKYRGHDGKIYDSPNHTHYTVFSLWDTYRAWHPLMTIIDEKRTTDYINTFLEIYKQSGRLPVWELAANETDCMIGYHAVSVIADAYTKGIRGFDSTLALEAMVASANEDIFGLDSYKKYGFIRAEDEHESVSKTLEYAYDDWCIAKMADELGEDSIADVFYRRAESWRNIINPETGLATPRYNADWLPNFDPKEVNLHFTEANSWQYSFVQQAQGGEDNSEKLEKKLDAFFNSQNKTTGRTQSDITGLIGQYAHGNEPSHHIAYLYNYTSHPEKGRKLIKQICDSFYTNTPDGLIGNEDCGQMSAWYVLSSMGFYPTSPGSNVYMIGTTSYDSVRIKLKKDTDFKMKVLDTGGKPFINGVQSDFFRHPAFSNRSRLMFSRSGFRSMSIPIDLAYEEPKNDVFFIPTPLIKGENLFEDSTIITIDPLDSIGWINYYLNGDSIPFYFYKEPFVIDKTTTVTAFRSRFYDNSFSDTFDADLISSPIISATFYKKPNNWTCTPNIQPNSQYTGGGEDALIDGINGTENWQAGRWQGYQHEEVTFVMDLKEEQKVQEISASFLQDARSWILMPSSIQIFLSSDSLTWDAMGLWHDSTDFFTNETFMNEVSIPVHRSYQRGKYKYLKVVIGSAGKLPLGHPGHTMDGDSFFFIDEIKIAIKK